MTAGHSLIKREKRNAYLEIFIIAFLVALSILLPYMIIDKGLFLFFGDYCVQQVPFYSLAHDAIRSGNVLWNWNTDLGANFIGSYAFYLLGSPFFWLTSPLPSAAIPYTLGPLLALKIALAALFAFAYIRRFVRSNEIATIGALLYAFSSWSVYDIFFNHFHEPMCLFPLMLIALEEFMVNDRKAVFVLTVFINALVNYIFFVSEVVFLIIYFIFRLASGQWKLNVKKFFLLALESMIGVGLAAVLLVPAILAITGNYRTNDHLTGWNLLLYGWNQRYPDILHSLFFPQDLPSRPNFFPDSNANWSSVAAWLPMFSMVGVLSFIMAKKKHWAKRILCVSLVMALIPGLNAVFVLFNDNYYARWFYMPILIMSLVTCMALEDSDVDLKPGFRWTLGITLAFTLAIGLIPKVENNKIVQIGLEQYPERFWPYVVITLGGLLTLYLLLRRHKKGSLAFANYATIALTVVICIYGNFFIATGKTFGWDGDWFRTTAIEGAGKIHLDETRFYRIDTINAIDNQGMFWRIPTINAFQSVVPASIMNFYNTIGVQRDVGSRPNTSFAGLRPFLSVRYLFDSDINSTLNMPGWKDIGTQLGFRVWENENYIPMGFTYDKYINVNDFNSMGSKDRLLLKAMYLNGNQIKEYGDILTHFTAPNGVADTGDEAMAQDCIDRSKESCSKFTTSNTGFDATINLSRENLVFFTVPYDSGWSATVNGKPAKVEEVNLGFMAVLCPQGSSSIHFTYKTPGLNTGILISSASFLLLAGYISAIVLIKRRKATLPVSQSLESKEAE